VKGGGGFTVMETLVALLAGWLLTALALGTLARQRTVQAELARRAEALAALRISRHVLRGEVDAGDGTELFGGDSVALRAYRGVGIVCAPAPDARDLIVRVRGIRAPDPAKDSVAVVGADGWTQVLALELRGSAPVPCPSSTGEGVERWRLSGDVHAEPLVARFFERGSYHLSGAALRYRRGAAGRQPLTPEVLRTPPSRFRADAPEGVELELFVEGDGGAASAHVFSLGPGGGRPDG
jgi:hypothetical protein